MNYAMSIAECALGFDRGCRTLVPLSAVLVLGADANNSFAWRNGRLGVVLLSSFRHSLSLQRST